VTGAEHFEAAERCLSSVVDDSELSMALLAEAQVHATLAAAYAHNRATTELTGLLRAMLDQIREAQEPAQ
jgi:hypothetical protein